jgi:hypothetical protein
MKMPIRYVDLFTKEEHVIIADWLGVEPKCDGSKLPSVWAALETLGFEGHASGYSEDAAAVASIVLERIQGTLPQWASVKLRENEYEETVITLAREVKARHALRTIELIPQYLLTINWADSGPGFSWPVDYNVAWVPIYDEYVVTQSADSPDAFGYCDFAIGHFPKTGDFVTAAANEIKGDWEWQRDQFCQDRWAYLFGSGLIDEATSLRLREEVWDDEPA